MSIQYHIQMVSNVTVSLTQTQTLRMMPPAPPVIPHRACPNAKRKRKCNFHQLLPRLGNATKLSETGRYLEDP